MPEPWVRVSVAMLTHPKMSRLPDDSARYGWVRVLAEAKQASPPGRFESRDHMAEHVGRFAGYASAYLAAGLLEERPDGSLVVHDWDRYQRDPTAPERKERWKERQRNAERNGDGNGLDTVVSRALSPSTSTSETYGGEAHGEGPEPGPPAADFTALALLAEELTGKPYALPTEHAGFGAMVAEKVARHGAPAVKVAMLLAARDATARTGKPPTVKQLVFALDPMLDPVVQPKPEPVAAPVLLHVPPGHPPAAYRRLRGCDKDPWHSGDCQRYGPEP